MLILSEPVGVKGENKYIWWMLLGFSGTLYQLDQWHVIKHSL